MVNYPITLSGQGNWFGIAVWMLFIMSWFTSFLEMIFWWLSYTNVSILIDIFYWLSNVQTWYLASMFWLPVIFLIVHIASRPRGFLSDDTKDHSSTVLLTTIISGFTGLVLQVIWADRLNLWYVKAQFKQGYSSNEAKNRSWSYPASLGSTARTWYNYTDNYIPEVEGKEGDNVQDVKAKEEAAKPKNEDFSQDFEQNWDW